MGKRAARQRVSDQQDDASTPPAVVAAASGAASGKQGRGLPKEGPSGAAQARPSWSTWGVPTVVGIGCCLLAWVVAGAPSLMMPLDFVGDNTFHLMLTQTLTGPGGPFANTALGLPGQLDLRYFPFADTAHLVALWLLQQLGLTPLAALNGFFFLTFGLCGAATTWALERCGLHRSLCILGAIFYALLPYHFWRGTRHPFLSGYHAVPIACFLILQVAGAVGLPRRLAHRTCIWLSFGLAAFGGYYAFFFCYLLIVTGAMEAFGRRCLTPLREAAIYGAATAVGMVVNTFPSLWYRLNTSDVAHIVRPLQDTEVYALKLILMLLPLEDHRSPFLSRLAQIYTRGAPMVNENQAASLGLVVSLMFVIVSLYAVASLWKQSARPLAPTHGASPVNSGSADAVIDRCLQKILIINGWAFAFGTVGGVSALLGFYFSAFIRSSNRISIFMAFFIILGMGWLTQRFGAPRLTRDGPKALACAVGLFCLGLFVWDISDINWFPRQAMAQQMWQQDQTFFASFESRVPKGGRIFQLPYVRFPEAGFGDHDYLQFRPFLHTRGYQWSFGATEARAAGWNAQAERLLVRDPSSFVSALKQAGFTGVLLARSMPSHWREFSPAIVQAALGTPDLVSPAGDFAYWPLP